MTQLKTKINLSKINKTKMLMSLLQFFQISRQFEETLLFLTEFKFLSHSNEQMSIVNSGNGFGPQGCRLNQSHTFHKQKDFLP